MVMDRDMSKTNGQTGAVTQAPNGSVAVAVGGERVDPQTVGREFVRQYYTLLHEAPNYLYRFYSNNSSFIHGGLGKAADEAPITGQQNIHNRIKELNFHDCRAKILHVDAQSSVAEGVVIQVTGELSNNGQAMRRFMQTFLLVPLSSKNYYVHNDIFRYADEVYGPDFDGKTALADAAAQTEVTPPPIEFTFMSNAPVSVPASVPAATIPTAVINGPSSIPAPAPVVEGPPAVPTPVQDRPASVATQERVPSAHDRATALTQEPRAQAASAPTERPQRHVAPERRAPSQDRLVDTPAPKQSEAEPTAETQASAPTQAKHESIPQGRALSPAAVAASAPNGHPDQTSAKRTHHAPSTTTTAPSAPAQPPKPKSWADMARDRDHTSDTPTAQPVKPKQTQAPARPAAPVAPTPAATPAAPTAPVATPAPVTVPVATTAQAPSKPTSWQNDEQQVFVGGIDVQVTEQVLKSSIEKVSGVHVLDWRWLTHPTPVGFGCGLLLLESEDDARKLRETPKPYVLYTDEKKGNVCINIERKHTRPPRTGMGPRPSGPRAAEESGATQAPTTHRVTPASRGPKRG